MASVVLVKIAEMFVIFLCGVLVYKVGLIDARAVRKMSDLLLLFITPLLIFQSYQMDFDAGAPARPSLDACGLRAHVRAFHRSFRNSFS